MPETPLSDAELQALVDELMEEANYPSTKDEAIYSLMGIYSADWVRKEIKTQILKFFQGSKLQIIDDLGLVEKARTEEWMERWHRRSEKKDMRMKKKSDIDALNPIILKSYLENFRDIMKRQMPNVSDEVLYQDGFTQMIELLLPLDKQFDIAYLEKIVDLAKTLQPPIDIEIPTNVVMESRRRESAKEEKEEAEHVVKERQQRKERGDLTLEEQMEDAIAEERYEDAAEIKQKMDALKRRMGDWHGSLTVKEGEFDKDTIIVHADNLDLIQPDKPYDIQQPDQLRQRHRKRFRNEPGGSDEVFMEGVGGMRNTDKGIGSDQYQDVGCPASINLANEKIKKLVRPTDPNMPNEKMERSMEEKEVTDTWRSYNDMQDK